MTDKPSTRAQRVDQRRAMFAAEDKRFERLRSVAVRVLQNTLLGVANRGTAMAALAPEDFF